MTWHQFVARVEKALREANIDPRTQVVDVSMIEWAEEDDEEFDVQIYPGRKPAVAEIVII